MLKICSNIFMVIKYVGFTPVVPSPKLICASGFQRIIWGIGISHFNIMGNTFLIFEADWMAFDNKILPSLNHYPPSWFIENFNKSLFWRDVPRTVTMGPAKTEYHYLQTSLHLIHYGKIIICCSFIDMGIRNHNISFPPSRIPAFPIIETDSTFSKVSFWMVSITRQSFHTPARHNPLLLIPVFIPKFADGKSC
jgi:hypothetical protein